MSLLITGAYGFIGSRVVEALLSRGNRDLILVDKPEYLSNRECAKHLKGIPFIDRAVLLNELSQLGGVTAVIHLGACTDTGNHDEVFMRRWNTEYTQALWRWCAEREIPF